MREWLLLGVPALMVGVGGICTAACVVARRRSLIVPGVVEDFSTATDSEGARFYRALVAFQFDGRRREVVDPLGMGWMTYRIGQAVSVCVPRRAPDKARILRWWLPWVYAGVTAAGALFLALGMRRV